MQVYADKTKHDRAVNNPSAAPRRHGLEVVPVVDLKGGVVVRAALGMRATYAPLVSPLAATSAPADVVAGLLGFAPFRTIYVADLDAIEGRGSHENAIAALSAAFPAVTFWVDAGLGTAEAAAAWLARHPCDHLVLGSESLQGLDALAVSGATDRVLLSLDFDGERCLGPEALLAAPELWPQRIIVMTLARVGSKAGPDLDRLAAISRRAPAARIFAAGGLRGRDDLDSLARAGASGVLVATALHDGHLTAAALAAWTSGAPGSEPDRRRE